MRPSIYGRRQLADIRWTTYPQRIAAIDKWLRDHMQGDTTRAQHARGAYFIRHRKTNRITTAAATVRIVDKWLVVERWGFDGDLNDSSYAVQLLSQIEYDARDEGCTGVVIPLAGSEGRQFLMDHEYRIADAGYDPHLTPPFYWKRFVPEPRAPWTTRLRQIVELAAGALLAVYFPRAIYARLPRFQFVEEFAEEVIAATAMAIGALIWRFDTELLPLRFFVAAGGSAAGTYALMNQPHIPSLERKAIAIFAGLSVATLILLLTTDDARERAREARRRRQGRPKTLLEGMGSGIAIAWALGVTAWVLPYAWLRACAFGRLFSALLPLLPFIVVFILFVALTRKAADTRVTVGVFDGALAKILTAYVCVGSATTQ